MKHRFGETKLAWGRPCATCEACGLVRQVTIRDGKRFFKKVERGVVPIGAPCLGYKNADIGLRPDGKRRFAGLTDEQAQRLLQAIFEMGGR